MKIKVGVMFGGKSVEHEVSIISAMQALKHFDKEKYDVIPIYITKYNEMYTGPFVGELEEYKNIPSLIKKSSRVILVNNKGVCEIIRYPKKLFASEVVSIMDVAFPIVHGTNVEDGTLQGYLKHIGVPFVGPDVLSAGISMDKYLTKLVLKDKGIPVLEAKTYSKYEDIDEIKKDIIDKINLPVIVKPINLGSSVGITKVKDKKELEEAIILGFKFSNKILVEKAIMNLREINCAVLGDEEECITSKCEEPLNSTDILTYEDKYIGKGSKGSKNTSSKGMQSLVRKLPADITKKEEEEIRNLAIKTFKAIEGNGTARIDFMMDTEKKKIYVNEINSIPGSLSFYLWEATDIKYTELLDKMIKLALKKEREERNILYSFETNILSNANLNGVKGTKGNKF